MSQPVAVIDFETFYDRHYSLSKISVAEYVRHPSFSPYLVSIVTDDGLRFVGPPIKAPFHKIAGHLWVSHNASFDRAVYAEAREIGRIGSSAPPAPESWLCSANLAAYFQFDRALKSVAKQALGIEVDKSVRDEMLGRTWEGLSEGQKKEVSDYALKDADIALKVWQKLSPDWPEVEREASRVTSLRAFEGLRIDGELLERAETVFAEGMKAAEKIIPWVRDAVKEAEDLGDADGEEPTASVMSHRAFRNALDASGIPAPETTNAKAPSFLAWEAQFGQSAPWVAAVLKYRKLAKGAALLRRISDRSGLYAGMFPFNLKYFGAAVTGRWSGEAKVNLQNLPKAPLDGISLRELFIPRPGNVFVIADFAQVEARVLAYLAGDSGFLELIRGGANPYEAHARLTMGYSDPRPLKIAEPSIYALAKARVLACGFGVGGKRFSDMSSLFIGRTLPVAESYAAVDAYRQSNPKVTGYWRRLDKFARSCGQSGHPFQIKLPSSRILRYWEVKAKEEGSRDIVGLQTPNGFPRKLYGGHLAENATQATARDIMADRLVALEKAGIRVRFSVHDELVCEVPEQLAESDSRIIKKILSTPPDWAADLPLEVEISTESAYTK